MRCFVVSYFPWDEGTLALLKTIHIEKVIKLPISLTAVGWMLKEVQTISRVTVLVRQPT
jgi:hypothetical protein